MNETTGAAEPFILCELAGASYAVRGRDVVTLEMVEYITPVPNAAPAVEGIVFSRGSVIPVVSLRARFGFERLPFDLRTRLVVVDVGGRKIGLLVDSAREFVRIDPATIEPPPDSVVGLSGNYIEGVATIGERIVFVLDLAEVASCAGGVPDGD